MKRNFVTSSLIKSASLLLSLAIIVLAQFLSSSPARALTVTPQRIELTGTRGSHSDARFTLFNETGKTQTYYLFFRNFEASDEDGEPKFVDGDGGLASWMSTADSVTLAPQERKEIPLSIAIPRDIEPGGYFAGVFASAIPKSDSLQPGQVAVQGDLGVLILLQTDGEFKEGADILEFATKDKQSVFSSLPIDFYFRFQNGGGSWVKPLGDVFIHNTIGQLSKIIAINTSGSNVLPRSIRRFELSWLEAFGSQTQGLTATRPKPPQPGFWNHVSYEYHNFALGRYTAQLTSTYGKTSTTTAQASTSFWVFPWHLLLVIGLGLAVLLVIAIVFVLGLVLIYLRLRPRKTKVKSQK